MQARRLPATPPPVAGRSAATPVSPDLPDAETATAEVANFAAEVAGLTTAHLVRVDPHGRPVGGPGTDDVVSFPLPTGGAPIVIADTTAEPATADLPAVVEGRIGAFAALPVCGTGSRLLAVLVVHGPVPKLLPPATVARLTRHAAVLATALEAADRYGDLAGDRQRWQLAVEAGGVGSFDWDLVTDRLDWDDTLMELFGYLREEWVPHIDSFTTRLHPEDVPPTQAIIEEAVAVSGRYRAEYRVVWPDGTVRWVAARGAVLRDAAGRPSRMLGVAFDVTEAHQARSMVQRTRDRLSLLAAVSSALGDHRDPERAIGRLASVLVPRLADFCLVSLVGDDGRLRDVGHHHTSRAKDEVLRVYSAKRLPTMDPNSWVLRAARTGRITVVPYPAWENILAVLGDSDAADAIRDLAPAFGVCIPMRVRDDVLGVITLFNDLETGPFGATDQQVAAEAAARAAVALDASRSFQRQRRIAETLQRSLLTAPPVTGPWQVAVRYVASEDDAQVGGDWYDAFPLTDGSLIVTVGDVMGHDAVAAARMGQVRSKLRGIFFATSPDPGDGLATVDAAVTRFDLRTSATVVAARLHEGEAGTAAVDWSLAGHPPPLVVGPGTARVLSAPVDPPLGVRAGLPRRTSSFTLAADETLLCYTDGLVERRDEDIDVGIERLRALAARVGPDPEALCDAALGLATRGGDDVALLAVRAAPRG